MMIRLLVGLVTGLLLVSANAAPPTDLSERIADLEAQNAAIRSTTGLNATGIQTTLKRLERIAADLTQQARDLDLRLEELVNAGE